ncbi:hypothetical protein MC885_002713 [Smutsia gigantea]|nr:hypothetical protein MC885_002713 [Smutsia gigantea]
MVAASLLRGLSRARAAPAQLLRAPRRGHRLTPADDELYQRTRISLLQRESPHAVYIDSYSSRGFTVNGNRVLGPCALLPRSVVQWNVGSHQEITEESLSLFWMLEPPIGTGGERADVLSPRATPTPASGRIWLWASCVHPSLEIVVVGTGDRTERLQARVLQAMRQRGIAVEVQDTPNACATFNFLCHEGRVTGAALIPPPGSATPPLPAQAAGGTS